MHGSPVLTNKQMETTQVVFIYRGPVKRATVITHRKVRLWTNRASVTGSAGTYIPAHLPRPTEPETRRGARGSVFPHLPVLRRHTAFKQGSKLLSKIREK